MLAKFFLVLITGLILGYIICFSFLKERVITIDKPVEIIKTVPEYIDKIVEVEKPLPEEYILSNRVYNALCSPLEVNDQKELLEGVKDIDVIVVLEKQNEKIAGITSKEVVNKLELVLRNSRINISENSKNKIVLNISILNNTILAYNINFQYLERVSIYRPHAINNISNDEPECSEKNTFVFKSSLIPIWQDGYYGYTGSKNNIGDSILKAVDHLATSFANDYLAVNQ
jgi:hypothetical protein